MREEAPTIRRLTVEDVADYRAIRLEALEREPGSFLSSYAREAGMSEEAWRGRLSDPKALSLESTWDARLWADRGRR